MINLISLSLLTLTAEVFTVKSFIKPLIPIFGKFMVSKKVNAICFIGALLYNVGYILFLVYTVLGLENIKLTALIYGLLVIGGIIYSFALFNSYTHKAFHSLILCIFGGYLFILGKKTRAIFGPLFHQMWDFEFEAPEQSQQVQPEQPVGPQVEQPADLTPEDMIGEHSIEPSQPSSAEELGKSLFPDTDIAFENDAEQPQKQVQQEEQILDDSGSNNVNNGEINLEEGFDI